MNIVVDVSKVLSRKCSVNVHPWKCASGLFFLQLCCVRVLLLLLLFFKSAAQDCGDQEERSQEPSASGQMFLLLWAKIPRRRIGSSLTCCSFFLCVRVPAWVCVNLWVFQGLCCPLQCLFFIYTCTWETTQNGHAEGCLAPKSKTKPFNSNMMFFVSRYQQFSRQKHRAHHYKTGPAFSFWRGPTMSWPTLFSTRSWSVFARLSLNWEVIVLSMHFSKQHVLCLFGSQSLYDVEMTVTVMHLLLMGDNQVFTKLAGWTGTLQKRGACSLGYEVLIHNWMTKV